MLGICVTGDMGGIVQGYLRGCVKAGALDNLDAVSFHPYNARTLSSVTPADEQIAEIREIVKGKPLFNTELFFLYDRMDGDPLSYPADNSMRRAMLDVLREGGILKRGGMVLPAADLKFFGTQHYRKQQGKP